jgi:hypothetical protein
METLIGIIVSILLTYIAYQNYKISKAGFYIQKDGLRLNLFDRRYKNFEALRDLLRLFLTNANFTYSELSKFKIQSSDAEFLFGKDIKDYLEEVSNKGLRVIHLHKRLENQSLEVKERGEIAGEIMELELWFSDQYQASKDLFKKYLHFSIDKNP